MKTGTHCAQAAELLCDYVDGALAPDEKADLEDHLRGCPACRQAAERNRAVRSLLKGSFAGAGVSENFAQTTGQRLNAITTGAREPLEIDEAALSEASAPGLLDSLQARMGSAPWWIISGAFHALLILLAFLIGMVVMQAKQDDLVIVTNLEKQEKLPEPEKKIERDILEKPEVVQEMEVVSEQTPVVTHEVVEFSDHVETADESDAQDTRGEDGISDAFLGGPGTVSSLGLGGGGRAGAFGRPGGAGGRMRRAIAGGGGKSTESAVDAALAWLARHQEADGHWSIAKYGGGQHTIGQGFTYDEAVSGLAFLAFLGAGHTTKIGKHKKTVQAIRDWSLARQLANGSFSSARECGYDIYDAAILTMALSELHAMTRDAEAGQAAQRGIDYMISVQKPHGGWDHGPLASTSVLGWVVMAMKSAKVAGLKVPEAAFAGALKRLESISEKDADGYWGKVGYTRRGEYLFQGYCMTAVGMVCLQFVGRGDECAGQAALLSKCQPKWRPDPNPSFANEPQDFYYWYYGTLGMFQFGGGEWTAWNQALKDALVPTQCKGGNLDGSPQDTDGSWDPVDVFSPAGGRVYTTAMGALCLEVYYRYLPIYRK